MATAATQPASNTVPYSQNQDLHEKAVDLLLKMSPTATEGLAKDTVKSYNQRRKDAVAEFQAVAEKIYAAYKRGETVGGHATIKEWCKAVGYSYQRFWQINNNKSGNESKKIKSLDVGTVVKIGKQEITITQDMLDAIIDLVPPKIDPDPTICKACRKNPITHELFCDQCHKAGWQKAGGKPSKGKTDSRKTHLKDNTICQWAQTIDANIVKDGEKPTCIQCLNQVESEERYRKLEAAGMCAWCEKNPRDKGDSCQECRDLMDKRSKRWKSATKAAETRKKNGYKPFESKEARDARLEGL
ncbi:MAG TPA: hypothetical protein VEK33_02395 [Terriglobales bacterium]|nr:hypothetical protein [Terriglobales bacterium]